MGKKGKGKKKEPEKPFTFDINNFKVERTRPGMMRLLPVIPPGFEQVAFKLRISKDCRSGKPKYDMVYYECSLAPSPDPDPDGAARDLRVFTLLVPDTGRTLIVDPKLTQGRQPFLALDPVANTELPIDPRHMIHHDPASGKNYLLDMEKFENGKLSFKDGQTNETLVADLTKRVDPLTHKPLHQVTEDDADVTFLGQIKNGENYVLKSEETGRIQILDSSGNPVDVTEEGYTTSFDEETNTTSLKNERDETVLTMDGKVSFEDLGASETKESVEDEETSDESDEESETELRFKMIQNPVTGQVDIIDEAGNLVEQTPGNYFLFENPATGKLELVDASGRPVSVPAFKLKRDPRTGRPILVDLMGRPLTNRKEFADMVLVNEEDVQDLMADGKGGFRKSKGSPPGRTREGGSPESRTLQESPPPSPRRNDVTAVESKRDKLGLKSLMSKSEFPDKAEDTTEKPTELEKYFTDLEYEEGKNIVFQVKAAPPSSRPVFLRVLREVIELNQDLIRCVLTQKRKTETRCARILLQEKQARQTQYMTELMKVHSGDYDHNKIEARVLRKLDRENELLLDNLDARITAENKLVMELIKENIMKDSKKIIRYTNIPCYRNFKRIVYKELMKALKVEIKEVKEEVCRLLKSEKDNMLLQITTAAAITVE